MVIVSPIAAPFFTDSDCVEGVMHRYAVRTGKTSSDPTLRIDTPALPRRSPQVH